MPKVKTTDYYGEWEDAPPLKLRDGMSIKVKWKNGKTTKEKLLILTGYDSAQIDMNNTPDHFETRHLMVKRTINGQHVYVSLKGLEIAL